jgi:alpha-ketoglutarate-dependent taurine dioxygenase
MSSASSLTDFGFGLELEWGHANQSISDLPELLETWALLVIRDANVSDESFVQLASEFGAVRGVHHEDRESDHPIRVQTNLDDRGVKDAGMYWHFDGPFDLSPVAATLLFCESAPTTGGNTLFVDGRAVLDGLIDEQTEAIEGLKGLYRFERWKDGTEDELGDYIDFGHRLVENHFSADSKSIRVSERMFGVVGLDAQESEVILAPIWELVESGSFRYVHEWRERDLVIWDNLSALHKATTVPPGSGAKVTKRITVKYQRSSVADKK